MPADQRAPVHLVVGDESLLVERALDEILASELKEVTPDNLQVLRGDEAGWGGVLDAARARSLFAPRRAVVVRGADALSVDEGEGTALKGRKKGKAASGVREELERYLDDPNPDVVLVLLAPKADRRLALWKLLAARGREHLCGRPKGRELRDFAQAEVQRAGLRLGPDGLEELIDRVGQDLRRLASEVEKLRSFDGGKGQRLGAEEVAAVLGRGLAQPFYKLGDLLWQRRPDQLLQLAHGLLDECASESDRRGSAIGIVASLHRSLRQLRVARELAGRRAASDEIVARTKVLPFKLRDLLDAARAWSDVDLARALSALAAADRRLKSSVDERVALAAAVAAACGGGGGGAVRPAPRPSR